MLVSHSALAAVMETYKLAVFLTTEIFFFFFFLTEPETLVPALFGSGEGSFSERR